MELILSVNLVRGLVTTTFTDSPSLLWNSIISPTFAYFQYSIFLSDSYLVVAVRSPFLIASNVVLDYILELALSS